MSDRITWTHELRVQLYKAIVAVMGHPCDVPRGSRGKPIGLSKSDYIDTLDSIGVAIGVGTGKGGALSNQIAWLTCIPGANCHQGHWNNREKNLMAADEAEYFTKPNIGTVFPITVPPKTPLKVPKPSNIFARGWNKVKSWFS